MKSNPFAGKNLSAEEIGKFLSSDLKNTLDEMHGEARVIGKSTLKLETVSTTVNNPCPKKQSRKRIKVGQK